MRGMGGLCSLALLSGAWLALPAAAQSPGDSAPAAPPAIPEAFQPPAAATSTLKADAPQTAATPEVRAEERDPFWPVGYVPGASNTVVPPPVTVTAPGRTPPPPVDARAQARALIKIQGFVQRGAQSFAMINGRMTGEGDVVTIQTQGVVWRFVVRRIAGREVTIEALP